MEDDLHLNLNAINLVQDIDDPNIYHIGVYDNNYPGEKRYVDMKCKNDSCYTIKNDYYRSDSFDSSPILMTPSLEFDLKYYN